MFVKIENTFFATTKNKIMVHCDIPYKVLNTDKIAEFYYRRLEHHSNGETYVFYEITFYMDSSFTQKIHVSSLEEVKKIFVKIMGTSLELE